MLATAMVKTIIYAVLGTFGALVLTEVIIVHGFPYFIQDYQFEGGEAWWLIINVPFYMLCAWVIAYHTQSRHWALRIVLVSVGSLMVGWSATLALSHAAGCRVF